MFALNITHLGPDRLRLIRAIASMLQIDNASARQFVDARRIVVGDARRTAFVRRKLLEAGVGVELGYALEVMDAESWVRDKLSIDKRTCATCGEPLFYAVPGRTTREDIIALGKKYPLFAQAAVDGWVHPGVYCPKGCAFVMVNLEHPDQYSGLEP
jgi:hypothetical protein